MLAVNAPLARNAPADALANNDDPALGTPAMQSRLGLDPLSALVVGPGPVLAGELLRHQALHALGLSQPQQQLPLAAVQLQQDDFVAAAGVAAHPCRSAFAAIVRLPAQRRLGMPAGLRLAGADLHVQHQARGADQEVCSMWRGRIGLAGLRPISSPSCRPQNGLTLASMSSTHGRSSALRVRGSGVCVTTAPVRFRPCGRAGPGCGRPCGRRVHACPATVCLLYTSRCV